MRLLWPRPTVRLGIRMHLKMQRELAEESEEMICPSKLFR